ncbi:MAG: polysaccharide deacetylase family protein [Proteobacteria bacterium]|nr:polysaccharide deacetylase family protein [Pseudomonadota bacterium]
MSARPPYPRDLVGYGPRPPDPRWPDGARVAVSLVLNYEEGGERSVLHGDGESESVLTDLGGGDPVPGARDLNVESLFEYGSRVGFWEIMALLRRSQVAATVYAVGMALERNPEAAAEIARSGFEAACHGQRWVNYQHVPEEIEREHIARNVEVVTRLIGRRPVGWYTGRPSPNTRRLVVAAGGFHYDSDAYNDDLPYWVDVGGIAHLVIPHSFDTNDSRLQRGGDFSTGQQFFEYCRDAFDWLYRMGQAGRPRMMTISLHGRIIGRPGRIGALERLLPARALAVLKQAIELERDTQRLDAALAARLPPGPLTPAGYARAYAASAPRAARLAQLEAILDIGAALDRIVHHASLALVVRLARGPAHAAGLGALQDFLERGFAAFRATGGATEFLAVIRLRESQLLERLYAGEPEPFRGIEP